MAMGLAYLGLGVGGALSQKFVALPLINAYGWQTALKIIGLMALLVVPICLFVLRDRPSDKGLHADGDSEPPPEYYAEPRPFAGLLRQKAFWLLAIGSFCSIGAIGSSSTFAARCLGDLKRDLDPPRRAPASGPGRIS